MKILLISYCGFSRMFVLLFVRIIDFLVFDEHLISFSLRIDGLHKSGSIPSVILKEVGKESSPPKASTSYRRAHIPSSFVYCWDFLSFRFKRIRWKCMLYMFRSYRVEHILIFFSRLLRLPPVCFDARRFSERFVAVYVCVIVNV